MYELSLEELRQELGEEGKQIIYNDLGYSLRDRTVICPMHKEDNPSAKWYDDRSAIWCFKCHKDYDIFNHLQIHRNMSVKESINWVRERLGLPTSDLDEEGIQNYVEEKKSLTSDIHALFDVFEFRQIDKDLLLEYELEVVKDSIVGFPYRENEKFISFQEVNINTLEQRIFPKENLLFNYENVKDSSQIIMTFNIMDFLTVRTLGYENVVMKSNKGSDFLEKKRYYDFFENLEIVTIVIGNDEKDENYNQLFKRIGKEKIKAYRFKQHHTVNHAKLDLDDDEMRQHIDNAPYIKIEGVKKLEDISFDEGVMPKPVRFGQKGQAFSGLDHMVDGARGGKVTVIVGRNNEGKTTVAQQWKANLIEQEHSVFVYDGESTPIDYKRKFYIKLLAGNEDYIEKKRINIIDMEFPKKKVIPAIEQWHKDKMIIKHSSEHRETQAEVFDLMVSAYKRHKCKVFFIDNLMTLLKTNAQEKYVDQADIVERIKRFAKAYYVHVVLVVHPNKSDDNTSLQKRDIHGASDIENKVDNIFSIMRVKQNVDDGKFDGKYINRDYTVNMILDVLKNRLNGKLGRFYFSYDPKTDKFDEIVKTLYGDELKKNKYSWEEHYKREIPMWNGEKQEMSEKQAREVLGENPF